MQTDVSGFRHSAFGLAAGEHGAGWTAPPRRGMESRIMPTFLHVGCGAKRKDETAPGFNRPEWSEVRLDIDPAAQPDIVADMVDMSAVASGSMDALFSSHNIEHLFQHQAPAALAEFRRVLKPDGFAVIGCPDLQAVAALVAEDRLTQPAYRSPAGAVTPHDMLYGFGPQMAKGHLFMAHRSGFTRTSLIEALQRAGFHRVGARRARFDLWVVASKAAASDDQIRALMASYLP